ncbi:hypothetical protein Egran_06291 [Elaphomyces granulatus]|uniref:Uncharacterized protein n=1 Tax=Elaphomyces granulatus TaxID=519963 RepID=A0A232LP47_9EURO|nr:hypothetical protein Egran_06291 [Elaphomyces granulatus]
MKATADVFLKMVDSKRISVALEAKEQLASYLESDYLDDRKVVNAIISKKFNRTRGDIFRLFG